jgi:diacylglycerol kinase
MAQHSVENKNTVKPKPFSWMDRLKSFVFAYQGIRRFVKEEHNAWLHGIATFGVLVMAIVFAISPVEWVLLVFAMGLVWVTEILNTSIEKLVDGVAKERNEHWAYVKDAAAGGVLIAAVIAFIIGGIIFLPKIYDWIVCFLKI